MSRLCLASCLALALTGCATSYRQPPAVPSASAFTFALTPEQCVQLAKERRTYRATQEAASYVGGAGAVLTTIFLALVEAKAAPAASAGASLAASGVSIFSGSQVSSLEEELQAGGCR